MISPEGQLSSTGLANEERYAAKAVNKMRQRKPPLPPDRRWSASTHVGRPQDKLSGNTLVASIDPAKHFRAISEIGVDVGEKRGSREIVERCPKPDTGVVIGHKVLKKEEVDVSTKIFEQSKEGRVSRAFISSKRRYTAHANQARMRIGSPAES